VNHPKAIVFDLDGTLIHSIIDFVKMKQRMIQILEKNGISEGILTPNETTVITLEKTENIWNKAGKPIKERIEVRTTLNDVMNEEELNAIPQIMEVEGATKAIRDLKEKGYKLAILTRSHHAYAIEALQKIEAHEYFEVILGRDETPKPKPYPEALGHMAKLLKLKMDEIVFVGDNHIDYQSAENSGCLFIGVRTGSRHRDPWEGKEPEIHIESVAKLPEYMQRLKKK
jgi:HAD superfamily hydrolase (TIGR01549 family)